MTAANGFSNRSDGRPVSGVQPNSFRRRCGTSTGRLMIAVLGGLADLERDLIRTRTAEGRSRAQTRGQRMGRPPEITRCAHLHGKGRKA